MEQLERRHPMGESTPQAVDPADQLYNVSKGISEMGLHADHFTVEADRGVGQIPLVAVGWPGETCHPKDRTILEDYAIEEVRPIGDSLIAVVSTTSGDFRVILHGGSGSRRIESHQPRVDLAGLAEDILTPRRAPR